MKYISKQTFKDQPKIFHVFSNLGCSVYQHFTQEILNNDEYKSMRGSFKGIIFDSCPGKRAVKSFINAMGFVLGGNFLRRKILPIFYFIYLIGKSIYRGRSGLVDPTFWWDYLESEDPIKMPHMYLYSKSDICVNFEHTKEMASIRRESGLNVTEKDFEDSEHVSHFDKHKEEYSEICLNFLTNL